MNNYLLKILVCPICHGKLDYNIFKKKLICKKDKLIFPIKNNIPIFTKKYTY